MKVTKPHEGVTTVNLKIIKTDHHRYDYAAAPHKGCWFIIDRRDGIVYRQVDGSEEDVKGIIKRLV